MGSAAEYNKELETRLKDATRSFALDCIRTVQQLKRGPVSDVLGRQLVRSASSVGANYRAACRAKSRADMAAKLAIVEEEADESQFWLDLLAASGELDTKRSEELQQSADSTLKLVVPSIRTLRGSKAAAVRENRAAYTARDLDKIV